MSYHYSIACVTCWEVDESSLEDSTTNGIRHSIRRSAGGIGFPNYSRTEDFLIRHEHHQLVLIGEGESEGLEGVLKNIQDW